MSLPQLCSLITTLCECRIVRFYANEMLHIQMLDELLELGELHCRRVRTSQKVLTVREILLNLLQRFTLKICSVVLVGSKTCEWNKVGSEVLRRETEDVCVRRVCLAGTDGAVAFCWHVSVLRCKDVCACVCVVTVILSSGASRRGVLGVVFWQELCVCVCVCVCSPGSSSREATVYNYRCRKTLASHRRIRHSTNNTHTHTRTHTQLSACEVQTFLSSYHKIQCLSHF